jgi:hypothetical protein
VPFRPSPEFSLTVSKLKSQIAEAEFLEKNPEHRGLASELLSLGDAQRVRDFLETWHLLDFHEPSAAAFDASTIRQAFDRAFFPHTETITKHYDQFLKNFDYSYQRRNLRQTFLLSLLVAVVLNLPFEQIFMRATAITPEQAVALAENAQALYQQANAPTTPANEQQRLRELGNQALTIAKSATNFACGPRDSGLTPQDIIATEETDITQQGTSTNYVCDSAVTIDYFFNPRVLWERLYDPANGSPRFLFGCFLTAILITFGAPFWNDLSGALLRIARPAPAAEPSPTKSKQGAKTEEQ